MRILFVGDIVGQAGRRLLKPALRALRDRYAPHLVVANGENAAGGTGITPATADEIFRAGVDVITTGNHVWNRREILPYLEASERLLRPANYPNPAPGSGVCRVETAAGASVAVINLIGRVFMGQFEDPFRTADRLLDELDGAVDLVFVDFHAEATSEKVAMGWYLDGRVAAVVGTHTHVATADERILPGGTAYITDLGMTGAFDSVIGVEKSEVLERFLSQRPVKFSAASGDARLCGALIDTAPDGRAEAIRRVEYADPA